MTSDKKKYSKNKAVEVKIVKKTKKNKTEHDDEVE